MCDRSIIQYFRLLHFASGIIGFLSFLNVLTRYVRSAYDKRHSDVIFVNFYSEKIYLVVKFECAFLLKNPRKMSKRNKKCGTKNKLRFMNARFCYVLSKRQTRD